MEYNKNHGFVYKYCGIPSAISKTYFIERIRLYSFNVI